MSEKKPTPGEIRRQKAARMKAGTAPAVQKTATPPGPAASAAVQQPAQRYPAIALIEYSSVTSGIASGDAMIKRAPIAVIKSGTVHNGKYLVLIGGSVGSVDEAFAAGLQSGGAQVVDSVILPVVHGQVHDAVLGKRQECLPAALGICETFTVAATLRSADAGVKGADVNIVEMRLADDIGGKAFTIFNGVLHEVEEAVRIAREACTSSEYWLRETIIPNLHPEMAAQVAKTTLFSQANLDKLAEGE